MKKRFLILTIACVFCLMGCVPAMAMGLSMELEVDGSLPATSIAFGVSDNIHVGDDTTGSDWNYRSMSRLYADYMLSDATRMGVSVKQDGQTQSTMTVRIDNLLAFGDAWQQTRGGITIGTIPITLRGAKAAARFDGEAQNGVRRAAVLPATSQGLQWLFRSAMAAVTRNEYPAKELELFFAIQDRSELQSSDYTANQLKTIGEYTTYGGVRVELSMAFGGNKPSDVRDVGRGQMVVETPLTTMPNMDGMALVALRVDGNGRVQRYPATINGKMAQFATGQFGDYIFITEPLPPTTGDDQPITLWMAMLLVSGVGIALFALCKRRAA